MQTAQNIEDEVEVGLPTGLFKRLMLTDGNAPVILHYLKCLETEISLSKSYKKIIVATLVYCSKFHSNKKFKDMTKDDIISFLNSYRKNETVDPQHSWIATYNLYVAVLQRFFKWLYYPDLSPKERKKPACVDNIATLGRKEISIYKPTDMWTQEDDLLFLKYCPNKRDKCYHMMARDSSSRPTELLNIKLKDIVFKMAGERQYAEVVVNGKTGQRHILLINSIPYLKDWLDDHPQSSNPDAALICGFGRSLGRPITNVTMNHIYHDYRKNIFPKLLNSPNVPAEDKAKIKELLKKPWNPYIRRHTALTEKYENLNLNELEFKQHAGWSPNSKMHLRYVHYLGNESNKSILEAYGLKSKLEQIDKLKPVSCPNCNEQNKIDSKFCSKCKMILTYDEYVETLEKQKQKESKIDSLEKQVNENSAMLADVLELIKLRVEDKDIWKKGEYEQYGNKVSTVDKRLSQKGIKIRKLLGQIS